MYSIFFFFIWLEVLVRVGYIKKSPGLVNAFELINRCYEKNLYIRDNRF